MANKNTRLGGTDWTDDIPLVAADLNDTFDAVVDNFQKTENKIQFSKETIELGGKDNGMYSAGDVISKFKITGGTGNNIENISVSVDFYTAHTTRPTYKVEYSTNNSAWTTIATEPTAIASTTLNVAGGITGTVDGLSNATYYIRLIGESQASWTHIMNFDLTFYTALGPGKNLTMKRITQQLVDAALPANNSILTASSGSAVDNIVLPVVISAPNGETITSVSALGHTVGAIDSAGPDTCTAVLVYSTDGTSYSAMDEANTEAQTGGSSIQWNFQLYGMKESLSSNAVYVAIKITKSATSDVFSIGHADLFVVATY